MVPAARSAAGRGCPLGEVGNTQLGEQGRLQTMLADPHDLPVGAPAIAPIPTPPRGSRARKSSLALPLALLGVALLTVAGAGFVLWMMGYEIEFHGTEDEAKPAAPPARPLAPAAAPAPPPVAPPPTAANPAAPPGANPAAPPGANPAAPPGANPAAPPGANPAAPPRAAPLPGANPAAPPGARPGGGQPVPFGGRP